MPDSNAEVMNGLVNKLYAVFTAPDPNNSTAPKDAAYISICSPGIALSPKLLTFDALTSKQDFNSAQQFARLVNAIPQPGTNWRPTGTLVWDVYGNVTDPKQLSLPTVDLNDKQKGMLSKAQAYLQKTVTKKDPFDDDAPVITTVADSDALTAYRQYFAKYSAALLKYNNALLEANAPGADSATVQNFARNGGILKDQVLMAYNDWEANGNKGYIEQAQGIIANLAGQGPQAVFARLRSSFEISKLRDTNGSEFYFTSPFPADVMADEYNDSWTKFSYSSTESHAFSSSHEMHSGASFGASYGLFGASGSADYHEATTNDSIDTNGFKLTVELLQVPLMRPWINFSVFQSHGWKWNSAANSLVSDGGEPPKGDMPLYPQSIILARNLKITMDTKSEKNATSMKSLETAVSASYGPFSVKGNYGFKDQSQSHDSKVTDQGLETPGLQLIAFVCAPVPKSPSPDPKLNFIDGGVTAPAAAGVIGTPGTPAAR
jgi:hypothetical protein